MSEGELCNPHNSYKDKVLHNAHSLKYCTNAHKLKVLHNAHKLKVLHKCTQRRITGMRSRGRRGIKIPHSSDFLTRLTPRPPHHPTLGIKYYTIHKRLKYCTNAHSDLPRDQLITPPPGVFISYQCMSGIYILEFTL